MAVPVRRKLLIASTSGLAVALGCLVWLGFQEPHGPRRTLPDGTVIELLGTTVGKHELAYTSFWKRTAALLTQRLPIWTLLSARSNRGATIPLVHTYPNTITLDGGRAICKLPATDPVVWFRVHLGAQAQSSLSTWRTTEVIASDADGCRFSQAVESLYDKPLPSTDGDYLAVVRLTTYPRRESEFPLELIGKAPQPFGVTFRVQNPDRLSTSTWKAARAPVTVTQDGIRATLRQLFVPTHSREEVPAKATFDFQELVYPRRKWRVNSITAEDATGNVLGGVNWMGVRPSDSVLFSHPCPREAAWKLNLNLEPQDGAAPDFTYVLQDLPLSTDNQPLSISRTIRFPGGVVSLSTLYHPARELVPPGSDFSTWVGAVVTLRSSSAWRLEAAGSPSDAPALRDVRITRPPQDEMTLIVRHLQPERPFHLHLSLTRLRHVEMLVQPQSNSIRSPS